MSNIGGFSFNHFFGFFQFFFFAKLRFWISEWVFSLQEKSIIIFIQNFYDLLLIQSIIDEFVELVLILFSLSRCVGRLVCSESTFFRKGNLNGKMIDKFRKFRIHLRNDIKYKIKYENMD